MKRDKQHYSDDFYCEMMRYQPNKLSYNLGLLAIVFDVAFLFIALNTIAATSIVMVKILGNILILLIGFLAVEKVKSYSKKFSLVLIAFGVICVARLFYVPLQVFLGTDIISTTLPWMPKNMTIAEYGRQRGIILFVLLGISAASFLAAGIVGYIKSVKLEKFLQKTNVTR
jgi:hypothetical protein